MLENKDLERREKALLELKRRLSDKAVQDDLKTKMEIAEKIIRLLKKIIEK